MKLFSRKTKQAQTPETEEFLPEEEARPKKSRTWVGVLSIFLALILAFELLTESASGKTGKQAEESLQTGTVEMGSITTSVSGAGTLTYQEKASITLPEDLEIAAYYVSNGVSVTEGQALAAVDTASLSESIGKIADAMSEVDEKLADTTESDGTADITAQTGGRVIKIYASKGDSVIDDMSEYGCLLLLSLDGKMAVVIDAPEGYDTNDEVTVVLSDKTEVDGKIDRVKNGSAVVTIADDEGSLGDSVTVKDGSKELGSGTLTIHSALKVTAISGTVSKIDVSEGDEVESGDVLLEVEDVDVDAEYTSLLATRSQLENEMAKLVTLQEDPQIYATADGIMSGLDSEADSAVTTGSVTTTAETTTDSDTTTEETATETSDTATSETGAADTADTASAAVDADSVSVMRTATSGVNQKTISAAGTTSGVSLLTCQTSADGRAAGASLVRVSAQTAQTTAGAPGVQDDSQFVQYAAKITEIQEDGSLSLSILRTKDAVTVDDYSDLASFESQLTQAGTLAIPDDTAVYYCEDDVWTQMEISELTVGDYLILSCDSDGVLTRIAGEHAEEDATVTPEATATPTPETTPQATTTPETTPQASSTPEVTPQVSATPEATPGTSTTPEASVTPETGALPETTGTPTQGAQSEGDGSTVDMSQLTGSFSASDLTAGLTTGTTDQSGTQLSADALSALGVTEETDDYSFAETTFATILSQEKMSVTITVDELDILKLSVGQEAQLTLDALTGTSYSAVITSIATSGTNDGGNTKYEVELELDYTDDMLAGMNADVTVPLSTASDILIIPAAALQEDGTRIYVYTSYDEDTEATGGETDVTTGVSDGDYVEITEGLSEGDTYYYRYADTVTYVQ